MATLWNKAGPLYFYPVVSIFFPSFKSFFKTRLTSAVRDWMSTILPHMVWPWCKFRTHVWNVLHAACWKYRMQQIAKNLPSGHHRTNLSGWARDVNETLAYETETFGFRSETRPRPRPSCNSTRSRRDRDVWFLPRDETETETLQGRDRDVFRDLQPSASCQNNEWQTCLSWCHKQLSHCNCNCSVHYHEICSPHKH